ncbi:MAG: hypothetical protein MUE64_01590 [Ignavibacteriaceae bacterium]|nr:hypothetical protein [Ignavibacteriaceae bacterium]
MQNVRSKVASKLSKIREAEDFNFSNWLKKPAKHQYPVEVITSRLADLSDSQIEFISPDISKYNFDMIEPEVNDELKNLEFAKVRTNAIFFMIAYPTEEGIVYSNVEIKYQSFSARVIEFLLINPSIKNVKVKFDYNPPKKYNLRIEVTAIYNYLSDLVPEVRNINLLEIEDFSSSAKKINIQNIDLTELTTEAEVHNIELAEPSTRVSVRSIEVDKFKRIEIETLELPGLPEMKKIFRIKVPSIGVYKFTQQKISLLPFSQTEISETFPVQLLKVKNWYANFKLSRGEAFLFYKSSQSKYSSDKVTKPSGSDVYSQIGEQLSFILSNVKKVDWDKNEKLHIKLKKYEEAGAKFLIENNYALLQDEFGIDIEKEVIAALKILFGNKIIKSALIITDPVQIGNPKFAKHLNLEIGWTDKLKKHFPESTFNLIQGNNDERANLWNKTKSIIISDIDTTLNDHHLKLLEDKRLIKIDCIVIDSVDKFLLRKEISQEFLSSIKPKILWATSSVLDKNIHRELNIFLDPEVKMERSLIRSKESIIQEVPTFMLNEFWCDADENQISEFKAGLTEARKDLRRVLETGNPLRFAANIFTLYHRLNQVGNFANGKPKSPKTDLLMKHILSIKANGKKVLVLSQYEKLGIKKIGELLTGYGIKHMIVPNGLSAEEMKKSISIFQSKKEIVALVSDAKTSKLKFSEFEVPYVITFDQWWNPITNWELEDMFTRNGEEVFKESINLCQYYSTGTLDQKVRELLLENDLLNRNVFELMLPKSYEELISIDEWLKIFGMPVSNESIKIQTPEEALQELKKLSIDEFRKILTRFFAIIGYSEIDILELLNTNSFNIVGKAQRNNRLYFLVARVFTERNIDQATLENILSETSSSKQDKIFIITRDSIPKIDEAIVRENVTLLDGLSLSKFLIRLGIMQPKV